MASYDAYPVLKSITRLTGRTADRKPSVITLKAIAADTGLKQAQVKAILARNDHALRRNDAGSLVGTRIVAAASEGGRLIHVREGVSGSTFWREYYLNGRKIGSANLDTSGGRNERDRLDRVLPAEHSLPICKTFADIPDEIVKQVWNEDLT